MRDDLKTAKIQQFLNNEPMAEAVKEAILESFLSGNSKDVNYLAASRIAIDLLRDAWKDLGRFKENTKDASMSLKQVGL